MAETAKDQLLRHADYLDRQGRRTLAAALRSWVETLRPIFEAAKQSVEYHAEREVDYPGYVWIEWDDLVQFVAAVAGAGHVGDLMAQAETDGIFRWDSDTIRATILGVIFVLGCVATAFQAPWFTTVFVSGLTGSWFIAERGRYWRSRQLEHLRGVKGHD